ncbi:RHS repeat domain-containing protein [Xenorhabdus ehlersii]|uniref:RHS repeat-associated protein n=1 Tax=Xenorhabdus ehlersii TaxID=290111 RepID=A0A2D0IY72_9GAMM|nr:RHS repeat-associated core domain-containing protein [Xenorhabdus ehlersii]PHM25301.1 rhsA protein in rhs element [Xenorhabdus ehlersii]PHM26878.1 rhsA protein in rhs element [Xenorhabdus ehlersii]RKE90432.1 RHS repeat-associated protein [Xenorhabdus ehlersii]
MPYDFFSNAHNFQSAATGSVDPRTGLFTYTMLVAQLTGNNHLGPTQTIALAYNPLNTDNQGFGIGFSLGLTQYDSWQRLLSLSTGERYKVDEYKDAVYLKQYKQDIVRFEKDVARNVYWVIHKSGTVEVLAGPNNAYHLKVPTQIFTPLGHSLKLDWIYKTETMPRLAAISDERRVLLKIEYKTAFYTRITVWPESSESYDIRLLFDNDKVTQISNETSNHTLIWKLEYDSDSGFLNRVSSPTGATEFVDYDFDGHQFPKGAELPPLPYVTQYTQHTKQGPEIIRHYKYTEYNFLGYGSNESWNDDEDYLYGALSNYWYGSTERWDNGTTQRHITRKYNKYHLLVSESTEQNGCKRVHKTDYYAQTGLSFEKQPPQFQMPKTASVSFNDASDVEVVQTEFDEAGNPTMQIAPDGTRTDWVYYPVEGEEGACPASPHGFVRFVKSKTVTPGKSSPEGVYDDAPIYQVVYRYDSLPTLAGAPCAYTVVCTYQGWHSSGQLLHKSQTSYVNDVNSPDHGRIHRIDETRYATLEGKIAAAGKTWTSQQTFSYILRGEALIKSTEWTGHDQLSFTTQVTQSQVSDKLWHEVDAQGRTTDYVYDDIGRISKHISNAHTDYCQMVQYDYAIEAIGAVTTTKTDVWGNQVRIRFNGLGHAYQKEILEKGQPDQRWQLVSEMERDSWGRVVTQTRHDWLPVENGTDSASRVVQVSSHQRIEYDDWGKAHRITQDTGGSIQHDYDPVTRTAQITRQAEGLSFSQCTVKYNKRHQPVTLTLYDSQGKQHSQQYHHYDGLGRLRATFDALGQKTEYAYDLLGRLLTISYSDGTVVRKSYAPFTADSLVTQIAVGDKVLGTRSFDSLHRSISTTSGGRTYCSSYQGENPYPSQIIDPLGQTTLYTYEPLLGQALTQVDAGEIQQRFTYDPKTGVMTEASAAQRATHSMGYTASGRLQRETFRFEDAKAGAAREANYTYSPVGGLTAYQDVTGKNCHVSFDEFGRPIAARDADIDVVLTYDAASRVKSWCVHDKQHDKTLTTTLSFDDFERETQRQIQTETDTLTLEQTYTVTGQIASRMTRSQNAGLLRQENYTYDPARYWLTVYHCTGSECPRDAYGFSITRQRFTYDHLGNILTCVTTLNDGSCDTATFTYNPSDPCQLHTVTHTHPDYPATITLVYDAAGRLIHDEAGRHLTYDVLGRLISASLSDTTSTYTYDATNRLVLQQMGTDKTHELYYQGATRMTEILRESGMATRLLRAQGELVATITDTHTHLLGTDRHSSVLVSDKSDGTQTRYRYSPYGQQAEEERNPDIPAYNGERVDPVMGTYHLGNGYRAYNPVLMRFNAPDGCSPFGAGGLNAYAYCLGDPINRIDPTGHISLGSLFGIIGGVIGLVVGLVVAIPTGGASLAGDTAIIAGLVADVTGIASAATEDSNPRASATLGWISLGLGALSLGAGVLGGIATGMRKVGEQLMESFSHGLSGRGEQRGMNLALPGGVQNSTSDYVVAFRNAINEGRVMRVENPAGTGIYTIGLETQGLLPEGEVGHLRRVFFRPRGDNSTIEIINNMIPLGNVVERPVDISSGQFEALYLNFTNTSILGTGDMSSRVVDSVNTLRLIVQSHIVEGLQMNNNTINTMKELWQEAGFSRFKLNDWLYYMIREAFPTADFPPNILLNDTAFQFFNNNFIPKIRVFTALIEARLHL